jgi:hypothetical protein
MSGNVGKYDQYVMHPPYMQMRIKADQSVIFNGIFAKGQELWGEPVGIGHQIVTHPFVSDNPAHTHNFQEYIAWYGTNPNDPTDFGGEVHIFLGEEMEEHVFTKPTVLNLPPGLVHCPLEIVRVDRPIIQLEIMLPPIDGNPPHRNPYFPKDQGVNPYDNITMEWHPQN